VASRTVAARRAVPPGCQTPDPPASSTLATAGGRTVTVTVAVTPLSSSALSVTLPGVSAWSTPDDDTRATPGSVAAQRTARTLARPVGSLRRAALALGAGALAPRAEEDATHPTEFEPVFGAFRRVEDFDI
jgi:hypothetical protein